MTPDEDIAAAKAVAEAVTEFFGYARKRLSDDVRIQINVVTYDPAKGFVDRPLDARVNVMTKAGHNVWSFELKAPTAVLDPVVAVKPLVPIPPPEHLTNE